MSIDRHPTLAFARLTADWMLDELTDYSGGKGKYGLLRGITHLAALDRSSGRNVLDVIEDLNSELADTRSAPFETNFAHSTTAAKHVASRFIDHWVPFVNCGYIKVFKAACAALGPKLPTWFQIRLGQPSVDDVVPEIAHCVVEAAAKVLAGNPAAIDAIDDPELTERSLTAPESPLAHQAEIDLLANDASFRAAVGRIARWNPTDVTPFSMHQSRRLRTEIEFEFLRAAHRRDVLLATSGYRPPMEPKLDKRQRTAIGMAAVMEECRRMKVAGEPVTSDAVKTGLAKRGISLGKTTVCKYMKAMTIVAPNGRPKTEQLRQDPAMADDGVPYAADRDRRPTPTRSPVRR